MENEICATLGKNIKKFRKARELNQEMLAEQLGIEIKSLSLIETGKGFVSARTLGKLAKVLNVSVAELFVLPDNEDAEKVYESVIKNLELIRNNSAKLKTINMAVKSVI